MTSRMSYKDVLMSQLNRLNERWAIVTTTSGTSKVMRFATFFDLHMHTHLYTRMQRILV